ncbi:MAG: M48 family metalloprotease [Candidatus Cloacimonetes bacterium]|nr:M48 family metalloprotease [Candidatus Cloacimonadota bacterium]
MKIKILIIVLFFVGFSYSGAGLSSFFRKVLQPVFSISESVIGKVVSESIKLQQGVFDKDPQATAWVRGIFDKVVREGRKEYKGSFDITILRSKHVNAMATPGGHIFVTYGLLQKIKSDDELATVLGHEVGHVVAGHSIKSIEHQVAWYAIMKYAKKKSTNHKSQINTLGAIYQTFSSLRYSRKNESESDYLGARYAAQAGYNPKGAVGIMEMFKSMEKKEPSRIEAVLRSHPLSSKRLGHMRDYMRDFPSEVVNRPMKLSYNFLAKHPIKKKEVKTKDAKKVLVPSPVKSKPKIVSYQQNFNSSGNRFGVAKGLTIKNSRGLFKLEEDKKIKGDYSQKIQAFSFDASPSLVSSRFVIKPNTMYILKGRIKTSKLKTKKFPTGEGACVILNENSNRAFVRGHLPQFLIKDSSDQFIDVNYTFITTKKTNFAILEFRIQGVKGKAWFDDFLIEEVQK